MNPSEGSGIEDTGDNAKTTGQIKYCSNCGAKLSLDEKVCKRCGTTQYAHELSKILIADINDSSSLCG